MVIAWLFDVALTILEWFLSFFESLPDLSMPSSASFTVPVPLIGSAGTSILNTWLPVAIGVVLALVVGKVLQWLYSLIPFKMT